MNDQELNVPEITGEVTTVNPGALIGQDGVPTDRPSTEKENVTALPEDAVRALEVPTSDPPSSESTIRMTETAKQVFDPNQPKPFIVNLFLASTARQGHLIPKATLEIDPGLRTSGLLAALPAEELKTLVALLTFLSPNGTINPTGYEVAQGLNITEGKAKERLSRLVRFQWQSRSLVATLWRETGMDGYTLSHDIVSYREASPASTHRSTPAYKAAGREAVIAASRAKYTLPRADVEREIAMRNGWPLPEEMNAAGTPPPAAGAEFAPAEYLLNRLMRIGVTAEQAEILLETFPLEEIELQIAWLPYRGAKNPASYLVAAITGRFDEPGLLRMKREQQALSPSEQPQDEATAPRQEAT